MTARDPADIFAEIADTTARIERLLGDPAPVDNVIEHDFAGGTVRFPTALDDRWKGGRRTAASLTHALALEIQKLEAERVELRHELPKPALVT